MKGLLKGEEKVVHELVERLVKKETIDAEEVRGVREGRK